MKSLQRRLTYANVVSSVALFLALTGATAFAATQLAANSVGPAQLRDGAVTKDKLASSLTAAGITHTVSTNAAMTFPPNGGPRTYFPLVEESWMQPAEEDELLVGRMSVTFPFGCKAPRSAEVFLEANGTGFGGHQVIGQAMAEDQSGTGVALVTSQFGPMPHGYVGFSRLTVAQPRTLFVRFGNFVCATGSTGAVPSLSDVQIDAIGLN